MAPKPEPRVFLDSNVIFSALYSPSGAPSVILGHFVKGSVRVVVSQQVLEEVIRVIKEKLPEALPALRKLLTDSRPEIVANPHPEEPGQWSGRLSAGDAAILLAAIAAPAYAQTPAAPSGAAK